MHTADAPSGDVLAAALTTMASTLAEFADLASPSMLGEEGRTKKFSTIEAWRIVRFYRWMDRFVAKEWDAMPFELRENGRRAATASRSAMQRLDRMSFRTIVGLAVLQGWHFIELWLTVRVSARVFRTLERKLAEQDLRATEAWKRALIHHPGFAEAVKVGPGNYDRELTVEVDWATFRPRGS
jgi:hypothetical protein